MRLLKCWTQYARKFGKLSSGHRTRKDEFSFQSQRMAVPKNVQTTMQVYSFLTLVRFCSKSFKLGFNSSWTEKFQLYSLDLEKAEEPEVKLPTSVWSLKKQENSKKNLLLLYWLHQTLWLCGSQQTEKNFSRDGNIRPPDLPPEESVCRSGSNS